MSTPPSWSAPDPERPNPFAAPTSSDKDAPGWAPAPETGPPTPPAGYPTPPPVAPGYPPAPYASDRATDPSPYGDGSVAPVYGAPQTPPGYGAPQAPPVYGAPQAPPVYGAPQAQPAYGYPPAAPGYGDPQAYAGQAYVGQAYAGQQQPPAGYGYPPPVWAPAQPPMDGLAIASIITSGAGIVTVGASGLVGIGLGIGALRRIRRTGARGRGLAISGVVVGAFMSLGFIAYVGFVAFAVSGGFEDSSDSAWPSSELTAPDPDELTDEWSDDTLPSYSLVTGLLPGLCYVDTPYEYDMSDGIEVDCAQPHMAEIVGLVELEDAPTYLATGEDAAVDAAWDACSAQLDVLTADSPEPSVWIDVFYPHPDQWYAGETSGYCLISSDAQDLVGSVVAHTLATAPGTQS